MNKKDVMITERKLDDGSITTEEFCVLPSGRLALSCFLHQQHGLAAHQRKHTSARQHDPKNKNKKGYFLNLSFFCFITYITTAQFCIFFAGSQESSCFMQCNLAHFPGTFSSSLFTSLLLQIHIHPTYYECTNFCQLFLTGSLELHLRSPLRLTFGSHLPIYDAFVFSSTFASFKGEKILSIRRLTVV